MHFGSAQSSFAALKDIHLFGVKAGLVISPGIDIELIKEVISAADFVIVMTVNPGFYGQNFLTDQLKNIKKVKSIVESGVEIFVDGGINLHTAKCSVECGADVLVVGSFLFSSLNRMKAIADLKRVNLFD